MLIIQAWRSEDLFTGGRQHVCDHDSMSPWLHDGSGDVVIAFHCHCGGHGISIVAGSRAGAGPRHTAPAAILGYRDISLLWLGQSWLSIICTDHPHAKNVSSVLNNLHTKINIWLGLQNRCFQLLNWIHDLENTIYNLLCTVLPAPSAGWSTVSIFHITRHRHIWPMRGKIKSKL